MQSGSDRGVRRALARAETRGEVGVAMRHKVNRIGLLALLISVVALAIRWAHLGLFDFWYDECYSGLLTFDTLPEILRAVRSEVAPPLYYVLLRCWAVVVGHGVVALRSFSVLAGVLTVGLMVMIGGRASLAAGVGAGLAVAIAPLHVHYSREARMYALLLLFLSGAIGFLLRALELEGRARLKSWVGYVLCGALAIWTHYFAVFALAAAPFAAIGRGRRAFASAWAATMAVGILALPLVPWALAQSRLPATEWIGEAYRAIPPPRAILRSLEIFVPGALYPLYAQFHFRAPLWSPLPFLLLAIVLLPGAEVAIRGRGTERTLARAGLAFLLVPLGLMQLVSLFRPVYLLGRYDLVAFPGFAVLAGIGIGRLPRPLAVLAGIGAVTLAAVSLAPEYAAPPGQTSLPRTVAERLVPALGPRDSLLFTGFSHTEVRYALRLAGVDPPFRTVPRSSADHAGWVDLRLLGDPKAVRSEAASAARDAAGAARGGRVWLFVDPRAPGAQACVNALEAMGYRAAARVPLLPERPPRWGAPLEAIAFGPP